MQQISCLGIPDLARPIVTASDELVTVFVEATIGEGQDMRLQGFKWLEMLLFLLLQFQYQLYIGHQLLSIKVFSCGFLLSVIIGSSVAIYSTNSSMSVLTQGIRTQEKGSKGQ